MLGTAVPSPTEELLLAVDQLGMSLGQMLENHSER